VNEAYLKLSGSSGLRFESRLHFNRIAARAMRQILVEAARKRSTAKRGGDGHFVIAFDESLAEAAPMDAQIIALHEALDELAKVSPRQATIVESRFFGGLTDREIAEFLDVSEATVLRDWRLAKAFLFDQMNRNV
jgi:RNA polymerase sigma factor (TIGR02999 family)